MSRASRDEKRPHCACASNVRTEIARRRARTNVEVIVPCIVGEFVVLTVFVNVQFLFVTYFTIVLIKKDTFMVFINLDFEALSTKHAGMLKNRVLCDQ